MKKSLFVTLIICVLLAVSALSVQAAGKTGWVRKGTTYKYKVNNTYVKGEVKKIKKYYYYFDKKGVRKTGWVKYKKDRYYFDRKTARAYTGKKVVNNKLYIFGKDGRLVKKKGLYKYGKTQVYINKNGSLATGLVKIKGKWYWFENNGVLSRKSGVHKWKNNTYYLNKGRFVTGWATVGSNKYYFGTDGKMATNKYIQTGGQTYYVDASGRMKKNCWYNGQYFNNKGQLEKNATKYDSETTEGQVTKEMLDEDLTAIPDEKTLLRSNNSLGHGIMNDIYDVVYVKTEDYIASHNQEIAWEIEKLNQQFLDEGRNYVLVGPGRWGSSDTWLGIPVKWPHISAARVIVEAGLTNYRVDPSQGTHFFQNLTSFGVGYFTINAFMNDGVYNQEFLNAQPAVHETKYLRHVHFEQPVTVKMDGKKKLGVVLMPEE